MPTRGRPSTHRVRWSQAPAGGGARLVPDIITGAGEVAGGDAEEIRLTYRELSALIEDAVRSLR